MVKHVVKEFSSCVEPNRLLYLKGLLCHYIKNQSNPLYYISSRSISHFTFRNSVSNFVDNITNFLRCFAITLPHNID